MRYLAPDITKPIEYTNNLMHFIFFLRIIAPWLYFCEFKDERRLSKP
jgi:hypothetical protein